MQFINIKDHKTGDTVKALNFGGPKCYKVSNRFVWAPEGGTSLTINENSITLEPLGLVINNPNIWTIVSHQNVGTVDWRITVKNLATNEEKSGVYPFNLSGNVYELECQPGTWVMASCGGYKIESSWEGKQNYELYRLKGTGEKITTGYFVCFNPLYSGNGAIYQADWLGFTISHSPWISDEDGSTYYEEIGYSAFNFGASNITHNDTQYISFDVTRTMSVSGTIRLESIGVSYYGRDYGYGIYASPMDYRYSKLTREIPITVILHQYGSKGSDGNYYYITYDTEISSEALSFFNNAKMLLSQAYDGEVLSFGLSGDNSYTLTKYSVINATRYKVWISGYGFSFMNTLEYLNTFVFSNALANLGDYRPTAYEGSIPRHTTFGYYKLDYFNK